MRNELSLGPIIADIAGETLTKEDIELIKHPNLGGLILFARNYSSPEQLIDLIKHIRSIRPHFFIGVDQEGGRVQRFQRGLTSLPSMSALGALFNDQRINVETALKAVKQIGRLMALELRSLGVDMSFAPVLDLATNMNPVVKERAVHAEFAIVSLVASHYVDGMLMAGMPACGKHFPGHGHVTADSHHALPIDSRDFESISDDLQPFTHLIKHGIQSIMTGHLLYPNIDEQPVTFSKFWLQEILRKKLNFNGAIISDDLNMDAVKKSSDMSACANLAINAGCDYLLVCNNRPQAEKVLSNTTPLLDLASLARREKILANKPAISWDALKQHPDWVEAHRGLETFVEWGVS